MKKAVMGVVILLLCYVVPAQENRAGPQASGPCAASTPGQKPMRTLEKRGSQAGRRSCAAARAAEALRDAKSSI